MPQVWCRIVRISFLLRPADPAQGNGRLLYEVNNRGRMILFANLCAGAAGNQPTTAADLGNALPSADGLFTACGQAGIPARRSQPGCRWRCRRSMA